MVDRNSKRHPRKRARITRISLSYGLGKNFHPVRLAISQYHREIFRTILVRQALDDPLILEVHRACGGSDEAFRDLEDDFQAGPRKAFGDDRSGDPVALTDRDYFFLP